MSGKTRTLLRYPGGKTKAVKHLVPLIEATGANHLVSPFFGGGAIELALVKKGWNVTGYDAWEPVVNFWQKVLSNPDRVADLVAMFRPVSNKAFVAMQKGYEQITCRWTKAAVFFTLNRCVHTGTGLSGGKTSWDGKRDDGTDGNPRLNDSTIVKLREFEASTLTVEQKDFTDCMSHHPQRLMYLDPPYRQTGATPAMTQLYSTGDFDHEKLAKILHRRDTWILSYNNVAEVRADYRGYTMLKPSWHYGNKRNASNELLILSHDLAHLKL